MLHVHALRHDFGGVPVLEIADWQVAAGQTCLVLGRSGAGKSTLLAIFAGLLLPRSGQVTIDGTQINTLGESRRDAFRAQRIGIMTQRAHFLSGLSVAENLLLAQQVAGHAPAHAAVQALLDSLGVPAQAKPRTLSQGQAQRAALARALVNRPALLLVDEPTANLDDEAAATVLNLLQSQSQAHGTTLVVATHDARTKQALGETGALHLAALGNAVKTPMERAS
jgi:putative ABC transport system ATP-binding protein